MRFFNKTVVNYPKLIVMIITAMTIFFGYHLTQLQIDNNVTNMLPEDNPTRMAHEAIEEEFGVADMVMIGLLTDTIFNTEFLSNIKTLSRKLKKLRIESDPFEDPETGEIQTKKKKCIADVTSISTTNYIEGDEYGMTVSTLMKRVPKTKEEMDNLKKRIFSWDFYINNMVSEDGRATIIAIEYKNSLSPDELVRSTDAVQKLAKGIQFGDNVSVYIAGEPFARGMIIKNMMRDFTLMVPAVFAVVVVFLIIVMRRISSIILIFLTIAVSVVWTMGLMSLFGFTMSLTTSVIPVLLVAIGSAYSIHIVNHYNDERAEGKNAAEAVENSISIVGISVFGAALTTMAGFMSLMSSNIVPIWEFGLFTGVGTGVAFGVSVVFVPALLLTFDGLFKHRKKTVKAGLDIVPILLALAGLATRRYKGVFAASIIVCIVAFGFSLKLYPDLYIIKTFKKNSEIRIADTFLCEKFSGTTTTVISLSADEDDYFKKPEALLKLDRFKTYLEEDPVVGTVISIAEPIKRMNYAMNGNDEKFNAIPETKEHVAQYLLLNSDPESLEGMVTSDYRKARIMVLQKDGSTATMKKVNKKITDWLDREMSGIDVAIGGTTQVGLAMTDLIVWGQIRSLIFSIITVLIISSFILGSFAAGCLAIMPLSICVILNFGILGMLGIPLDAGTAMISSIAIGIAVDYSIHLLNGIRYSAITKGLSGAVDEGIRITGNAITFNAFAVALGFLVLTFSSFTNLIIFGCFVALTMVTACISTLVLIPVLVHMIKPKHFHIHPNSL